MVLGVTIGLLGYIFYTQGGKIQSVVLNKQGTRYVRSATIINIVYIAVLYIFKELNNLPMSTTWVFVGLLAGRELAISTVMKDYKFVYVFPIIAKDFGKMMLGLGVSVAIVLVIHYILIPSGMLIKDLFFSSPLILTNDPHQVCSRHICMSRIYIRDQHNPHHMSNHNYM